MFGGLQVLFELKDTRTESPNRNMQVWILLCGLPMHSEIVSRPSSQRDRPCGFDQCGDSACHCFMHIWKCKTCSSCADTGCRAVRDLSIRRQCVAACRLASAVCFCQIDSPKTTRQTKAGIRQQGECRAEASTRACIDLSVSARHDHLFASALPPRCCLFKVCKRVGVSAGGRLQPAGRRIISGSLHIVM